MTDQVSTPHVEAGKELFRPRTLAQRWDMSLSMIYKLIDSGELEAARVGRSVRIPAAAAQRFLERAGVRP